MTIEKIEYVYKDFSNALKRLNEVIKLPSHDSIVLDATIQRFEFTFELSWKLAKVVLAYTGIEAVSPRSVIKEAFGIGLIKDGEAWLDMLEDRNKTSHIYDEKEALVIFRKVKNNHFKILEEFSKKVKKEYIHAKKS